MFVTRMVLKTSGGLVWKAKSIIGRVHRKSAHPDPTASDSIKDIVAAAFKLWFNYRRKPRMRGAIPVEALTRFAASPVPGLDKY